MKLRQKSIYLLLLLAILFFAFGCGAKYDYDPDEGYSNEGPENKESEIYASTDRKIIYEASATVYISEGFEDTVDEIVDSLDKESGEWPDEIMLSENYARLSLRVKADRLDAFLLSLKDFGEVRNLTKTGEDVSLHYQDITSRIEALEAELNRLLEMYDEATNMSEIIQINARRSEIERDLNQLQGSLNHYDSYIEYSVVDLSIHNENPVEDKTFGQKIVDGFKNGWDGLLTFLEFITIAFVTLFPFIVVFGIFGTGLFFLIRIINKKKKKEIL